jgi:signal transduction histidine kinase
MVKGRSQEKKIDRKPAGEDTSLSQASSSNKNEEFIQGLEAQIKALIFEQQLLNRRTQALKRSNMRLAELNQAKDEFIAVASHQLRTPATAVKQYIRLLLDGYGGPLAKDQMLFLEKANESNDRQLKIIDDLLQVARIDAGNIRLNLDSVDIVKMLQDVVSDLINKSKLNKQSLTYSPSAKTIMLSADVERLRMVFENIIDNAINYSEPKTKILITARTYSGSVIVTVKDEGVGIGRSDYSKLFQKFSRIPNPLSIEVGGTGLGLYWAQKVAELHGGRISVKSREGSGSTFTVTLPIAKG